MSKSILSLLFIFLFSISCDCQELTFAEKNGQYGFFLNEKMVLDFQYDSVHLELDGSYTVLKEEKWGVVNPMGEEVISCKYDDLHYLQWEKYLATYNGAKGIIDTTGTVILEFKYDEIDHFDSDTQYLVKYHGKWVSYKNGQYNYNIEDIIFLWPDTMPHFPGCNRKKLKYDEYESCSIEKIFSYIFNYMRYPVTARNKGIQGQVIVSFVISKEGEVQNPKILRGLGGGCDEEVLRVINSMPNWIPGVQDGIAVNTQFNLPVKFVLK